MSTNDLCEDVIHAAKPTMMTNASKKIKKKTNSPWFSNTTKKNTIASTKNANDYHRGKCVTPYKPV